MPIEKSGRTRGLDPGGAKAGAGAKPGPKAPQLLKEMRHVWKHPDMMAGESNSLFQLKKMLAEDATGFYDRMQGLERAFLAFKSRQSKREAVKPVEEKPVEVVRKDIGLAKCVTLAERLLGEIREKGNG